jgi:hypothetical protein
MRRALGVVSTRSTSYVHHAHVAEVSCEVEPQSRIVEVGLDFPAWTATNFFFVDKLNLIR